jgi:hypothetical protein
MADLEGIQALRASGSNVVRVTLPTEVYYNLDKLQKVQKEILGRLGHAMCYSGFDIRWDHEKYFVVDQQLNIKAGGPGF